MPRQEFLNLKKAYDAAEQRRRRAVGDLIEFEGRVKRSTFEKLTRVVNDTGDTADAAWNSLEKHRMEHRCDEMTRKSSVAAGRANLGNSPNWRAVRFGQR